MKHAEAKVRVGREVFWATREDENITKLIEGIKKEFPSALILEARVA